MEAETIQKIVDLKNAEKIEVNGFEYVKNGYQMAAIPSVDQMNVRTLDAIADYIELNPDKLPLEKCIVHVESPISVRITSTIDDKFRTRETYLRAKHNVDEFPFSRNMEQKEFITAMQTKFVKNDTLEKVLKVVGNVADDQSLRVEDDGVTQMTTARTGVVKMSEVEIPNPVSLSAKRTFPEVEQPQSDYILRMDRGPRFALHESDNALWEREAIDNIAKYLKGKLPENMTILS